jgi:hypothetical protein
MDPGLRAGVELDLPARIGLCDERSDDGSLLDRPLGPLCSAGQRCLDDGTEQRSLGPRLELAREVAGEHAPV